MVSDTVNIQIIRKLILQLLIYLLHYHILPLNLFLQNNVLLMRKLSMDELNRKSVDEFKESEKNPVIAVLENIRSAYNVGSVFRTADAFLIESIFITGYTAKPPHKEITKTALGAQDSVDWKYFETTKEAIEHLKKNGYKVYAVEQVTDSISLERLSYLSFNEIAFVFGNEVSGLEHETISLCDGCVEIPQFGMKHSLNISVAAGIVLWEALKKNAHLI
jgi:23S rRNA (guanosine2251-2'-O)-methyltransferase